MGKGLRLPFFGLRAGILAQLVFLIIAAMLLVNMVILHFSIKDLIEAKIDTGRLLIRALEQNLGHMLGTQESRESGFRFKENADKLLLSGGYSRVLIVDTHGSILFSKGLGADNRQPHLTRAVEAEGSRSWSVSYSGSTWGVLWLGSRDIHVSAPLSWNDGPVGGITISSSLDPIYQTLRRSEKMILLYIILDTIILALVGMYILSRIVVRPIHRLLKMTEEYQAGEGDIILPVPENTRNEIGDLTRSLGVMLQRLDENKRELKEHISSLEWANRELRQAQNEIIRSEKLASVGRLTAGIAHEIGNPISIILGYLELIRRGNITDEERKDFIHRVESEINRVRDIISQLLDFSRPSSGEKKACHLHEQIKNTVNMMKPQPMMEDIEVTFDLRASKDTVFADPNQLQQVFLNVIMNAADVLNDDRGRHEDGSRELKIASTDDGDSIKIWFKDNGPGIDQGELSYIFDPFYTTKDPGKGTGLGLSVCYRIVEEQGGDIFAESSVGEGTTIIVRFPVCADGGMV